nr:uncharacterized protein LOC104091438 [Nicotiana tomentosiformis]
MLLPPVPDEWTAEAFTKGLNPLSSDVSRKLKESLLEFQATTWADVHNRYESKIRIEDDQLDHRSSRSHFQSYERADERGNKGFQSSDSSVELVLVMRNIKEVRFLKPIRSDPSQRDPNIWREFHGTHGHRTGDCRHLREEVATLLKNGYLREFLSDRAKKNYGKIWDVAGPSKMATRSPRIMISIIFGGDKVNGVIFLAAKKTKILLTHGKRIREVSKYDTTFTEEDVDALLLPHNDALVISLNVLDFKIKRVLVDPGSLANIAQWRVLEQAKLTENIDLVTKLLDEFNLTSVMTRGEILLPTHAEGVTKTTLF